MNRWQTVLLAVVAAELAFGALALVLDTLQGPCTDLYCWAMDKGWISD